MQLHKRFTADQVKALLQGYCQGVIERQAVADILGIGKTRSPSVSMESPLLPVRSLVDCLPG